MPPNPLDTLATSHHICALARANHLTHRALEYALRRIGTVPDIHAWQRFIDNMLLLLGTALLLVGIIFFFAYNWADMSHFTKFGVLEAGVLSAALFASWRGLERLSGQAALLAAAVLLGGLLAVYAQVYQTGADVFELFLTWAIFIIPWVLLGAFAPLWLLLLVLLNLSLLLYWDQVINPSHSDLRTDLFLLVFLLNGAAMLAFEFVQTRGVAWLQNHWMRVIIFGAILTVLIIPTLQAILETRGGGSKYQLLAVAAVLYMAVTALSLWYYRYRRHDLLLQAMCLLGVLIVVTTLVGKLLPLDAAISWLILAIVIIGQAALATKWLLQTAKTWQEEANND